MRLLAILGILALTACGGGMRDWDPFLVEPPRPDLGPGADANSAQAYFDLGERLMRSHPTRAADAFHWAARLDPAWADPLYARRMAIFMANPQIYQAYVNREARVRESPGVQKADSIYRDALTMNPFLRRRFDSAVLRHMLLQTAERNIRRENPTALVDQGVLESWLDMYLRTASPWMLAWVAHSEGRYREAVVQYRRALDREPKNPGLQADLARVLFLSGQYGESQSAFAEAVSLMEEEEAERVIRVYESKALFEHGIGLIHEQLDDPVGAREAYARALQEDLAYHPAHIRLGELALLEGDTLTAVSALALAAQIRGSDAGVRYQYGQMLRRVGQLAEARDELQRAIELEPLFALPHLELARVLDAEGELAAAAGAYQEYLARAGRSAPFRLEAEGRLDQIANVQAGPGPGQ
jgi:tetratricopeptide (TPR) repeat protein